jgi:dCMP deaminase
MDKWDKRYMNLAKEAASWSKDPSSKIGAVAIGNKGQVLSTGYNGFPRNIRDLEERLADRNTKYKYVVHAEMNLIYNAVYNGVTLDGSTLYVYGLPCCSNCALGILQVGVKRVVMAGDVDNDRWKESTDFAMSLFEEAGVKCEILRFTDDE